MKTTCHLLRSSILGLSAAMFVPFIATAVNPGPTGGPFTNIVNSASNAVWDFGGIIDNVNIDVSKGGTEVTNSIPVDFTQSGTGKVSATQTGVQINLGILGSSPNAGTVSFPATVTEKGSINSTKGGSHLIFTVTATGTAPLPGESGPSKITLSQQINATIIDTNQMIIGINKQSASASGVGGITETKNFTNTVAEVGGGDLGDGSWQLVLDNLATTGSAVTGTATITLNSGQSFNYTVKGTFSSTKGSKLLLTGSDANSKGSSIQVTMDTGNVVTNIKGRITGQNVNANF